MFFLVSGGFARPAEKCFDPLLFLGPLCKGGENPLCFYCLLLMKLVVGSF